MKTIILENDRLKIELLPEMGGKILSFFSKEGNFELAAQPARRHPEGAAARKFSDWAFGMDDTFPSIDAETVEWKGRRLEYPDHGEIWKNGFALTDQTDQSASLFWKSESFGYSYQKESLLKEEHLTIRYRIVNESENELPCLWTWHGLLRYEQDVEFSLPEEIERFRNVLSDGPLGEAGILYPRKNPVYDFERMPKTNGPCMVKYYGEEPVREGICEAFYPAQGMLLRLSYDAGVLPYLGVWITAGGFQGDYNWAIEPTSGFYDSVSTAEKNKKLKVLGPGEVMEFELTLSLSKKSK